MPLTARERKRRIPHGAQQRIATVLTVPESYVSRVLHGRWRPKTEHAQTTVRRIQDAIALELGLPVGDVFEPLPALPPEALARAS